MVDIKDPLEVHKAMYKGMTALDYDEMFKYIDENVTYQNMAHEPMHGRDKLRAWWDSFDVTLADPEFVNVAVNGNIVFDERRDHMILGGKEIRSHTVGVFEINKGRITFWREYWDIRSVERQVGKTHPSEKA